MDRAVTILEAWVDLAERTLSDHAARLDANRSADFLQGVRETKEFLNTHSREDQGDDATALPDS